MNTLARKKSLPYAEYCKVESEDSHPALVLPDSLDGHPRLQPQAGDRGMQHPAQAASFPVARQRHERPRLLERMAVRLDDRIVLIQVQDVFWFQSKGNLLCLHLKDNDYDCRMTLKDLRLRLDPDRFLRIHRNAIVNLDRVTEFDLPRYGNAFARLHNGKALPISRTGRVEVRRSLLRHSYWQLDE
jgi:DNA-binding LytR/AlgR family response regulator